MPSVKQQQECPRRAGASAQTGELPQPTRASRQSQHPILEHGLPRVLSAGTVALAVASAAVLMLAGCASMGHQSAPVAIHGADTLGLATAQQTTPVEAQWWHQFGDARLDDLVAKALAGSPNLGAAQARVVRAQAVVDSARGAELPHVDFDASVKRELLSRNGLFPPPYGGSIFNQSNATFGLKWDADLFGREKADLEAASAGRVPRRPTPTWPRSRSRPRSCAPISRWPAWKASASWRNARTTSATRCCR